jgi:acyl-CoA synthetase (AMP-forming)/AMP-acid ligase II
VVHASPGARVVTLPISAVGDRLRTIETGARPRVEPLPIVDLVLENGRRSPDRVALVFGDGSAPTVSYGALTRRVQEYALGFARTADEGRRVLLLLPPSLELYAVALGALAAGLGVAFVDGRLDRRRALAVIARSRAEIVIGVPNAMRLWLVSGAMRAAKRFTVGSSRIAGAYSIHLLRGTPEGVVQLPRISLDSVAVMSLTSGNSGEPKSIERSHRVLLEQHRALRDAFPLEHDDVGLSTFPMAILHALCLGTTSVLPPARWRSSPPSGEEVAALVRRFRVTSISAPPLIMRRLAARVLATREPLTGVRHLAVGGGPVSRRLCTEIRRALPAARAHVVYGATEAEPIAIASMADAIAAHGSGFLAGRPAQPAEVVLLPVSSADAAPSSANLNGVGEVAVRGPHVAASDAAPGSDGWHRTGDLARIDQRGRLWLVGRVGSTVVHRGRVLHPYVIEAAALEVPGVEAAGLVAHRRAPQGELAIQLEPGARRAVVLHALAASLAALEVSSLPVRVLAEIPMDARHGSKVDRQALARRLARRWW